MDAQTIAALADLNRRFYERHAAAFDATRERPWPGWLRVLESVRSADTPLTVLDVGCGNGRFAAFLADRLPRPLRYLGVDASAPLLAAAAARLAGRPGEYRWQRLDVLRRDLAAELEEQRYDLIALFGVLHHVPGEETRITLLRQLASLLADRGLLAASIWQPPADARGRRRVIPWSEHNRRLRQDPPDAVQGRQEPIDESQLEPGDRLLSWAGDVEVPRYCHFPPPDEIERWLTSLPELRQLDRFAADGPAGRDNLYLVLGR